MKKKNINKQLSKPCMILAILAITYSIIVTFSIINATFDPYELGVN